MRKLTVCLLVTVICLVLAAPAMAADRFAFTEKSVTLFEGETIATALRREGVYEGDGEIEYTSAKPAVATVDADGTITAVSKGQTEVTATLRRDGKRVGNQTRIGVKVQRAVTKVTLNTTKMNVYNPDDPQLEELLWEAPMYQVLVIPAGSGVTLNSTCTPEDASSRQVTYTSSDAGVAKVTGNGNGSTLKAVQKGECDLTVASVLNPDVTETFHVLVIQPVKKITIDAGGRKVAVGSSVQLIPNYTPEDASIKGVKWESKKPGTAAVDENGVVTGLKKGDVSIVATAIDASKVYASVMMTVTQSVESITFSQAEIPVVVGRTVQAKVTVLPDNANDKSVTWSSSDESIATVKGREITGKKAGICTVTCTSKSNPDVSASVTVIVSQLVTKVENTNMQGELTLQVGQSAQTRWRMLPDDATTKELTFSSQQPKIATVDENGVVTAVSRGTATITATSRDASKKQATTKVTVLQPVTGLSIQKQLYYVQRGRNTTARAEILPKNANNQQVIWVSSNEEILTVKSNGTSTGSMYGVSPGYATVTAITEDGGYTATTSVRVGNFNEAVQIEELYVINDTNIQITLRNASDDIVLQNIHYRIECYDSQGNPMVCNNDGVSTFFEGNYPFAVQPRERTAHGSFRFQNYVIPQRLGKVVLTVTGWKDESGFSWSIPDSEQPKREWYGLSPYQQQTQTDYGDGVG